MEDIGFLRLPEVIKMTGIKKSTWYDGIRKGIYPKQVRLSGGAIGWRKKDIRELCERLERGEVKFQ